MENDNHTKIKRSTLDNLKFVFRYIWKWDKSLLYICGFNSIFIAVAPFIWILAPKFLIDELMGIKRVDILIKILLVTLLISAVTKYFIAYLAGAYRMKMSNIRFKFIDVIHEKAMEMDYKHTEDPDVLNAIRIAWRTVSNPHRGIGGILQKIFTILGSLAGFLGYIAIILTLNPLILLYLVVNVIIIYFINLKVNEYEKSQEGKRTEYFRKSVYVSSTMSDFQYGKDIRVYSMKDLLLRKKEYFDKIRTDISEDIESKRYRSDVIDAVLLLLREGIVYGYLIHRVVTGSLTMGNFTMYVATIGGFALWMGNLMKDIAFVKTNCKYVGDLRDFLDIKDEEKVKEPLKIPIQKPYEIEFKNVSFKYPNSDNYIFKNLSLKIKPGQKLAIVGVNGAGKTSLVKLLTRLYSPIEGEIYINGININQFDQKEYYRLFSIVFQEIKMFAFNVTENIALKDKNINHERVKASARKAGIKEKIDSLEKGFSTSMLKVIDEHGIELSGGENQKLALARALYKSGEIVVLDEPTAALDPIAEHNIYLSFNELIENRTAIYISHRLSSTRFCDVIAFMEDGEIKEYGTHDELMEKDGKYASMFNIQSQYYKEENMSKEAAGYGI